jgi:uncharacterized protein with HEPN domain
VTRSDGKRLDDILDVADEIASIVARGKNNFDDDIALRRAVERCLEIVGEAAKSVDDEVRASIPDVPWTEVIRLRDRLSHHYHRVEADQLWVTADTEVPKMAGAIRNWRSQQQDERRH